MKIIDVAPDSPLFGYIRPGYSLKSINDNKVVDNIDFRFKMSDDRVKLVFENKDGEDLSFDFYDLNGDDLGLTLEEDKILVCKNDCIFCFVRQQPPGMRRSLYVKDEDYRLSFTHGNFITLSNATDKDLDRVIEQRLSPMYISVHTTDDKLRRCMFKNEKLSSILPQLVKLTGNGIKVHTQVVLCPGINDGKYLEKTVNELAELFPGVETLGVVPVGLTKYRSKLADLRTYNINEANEIIDYVENCQKQMLKDMGTRFVWCADEFYIQAKREFPEYENYEDMAQFENGIGMVREFINMFNKRKRYLKNINSKKRVLFLTGQSAAPFLKEYVFPELKKYNFKLLPVKNNFWGETVTVSGLLTGQDLLGEARKYTGDFETVVLPPNCLNDDDLFLDNMSLNQFTNALNKEVVSGDYNFYETLKGVLE